MMCTCTSVYCILSIHLYINVQGRSQGSLGGLHDVHGYIWGPGVTPAGCRGSAPCGGGGIFRNYGTMEALQCL